MILFIDTADNKKLTVALFDREKTIAWKSVPAKYRQAEMLLVEIEKLLKSEGYALKALTAIAVAKGPGSFTALRIGVIAANTLSYVLNIPVVGLSEREVEDKTQLSKIISKQLGKKKIFGGIVEPFYGKEPNITKPKSIKKSS